jgi:hypothetical protein
LAATLAFGAHGVAAKLLVLPEFILVVALARVVLARRWPPATCRRSGSRWSERFCSC